MDRRLALISIILITAHIKATKGNAAQVEVRAVLISCEPDDGQSVPYENDAVRFEREELFKHSVLRDCKKKIALTVKIASDPELDAGDEYIPIEHVFQGPMKRVRLLNPYVLRLRREAPVQAYKLRKLDTVCGTLSDEFEARRKRSVESPSTTVEEQKILSQRSERSGSEPNSNDLLNTDDESLPAITLDNKFQEKVNFNDISQTESGSYSGGFKPKTNNPEPYEVNTKIDWPEEDDPNANIPVKAKRLNSKGETVREYDMFEIGKADLWYTIQVQLFEKLTTSDGKTAWNDLTRGAPARVSSASPEWTSQDICILYKSSEWIPREGFSLPTTSMCLLAPISRKTSVTLRLDEAGGQYIVVPREDVVSLPLTANGTQILVNEHKLADKETSANHSGKPIPRVVIRAARALLGSDKIKVNIVPRDGDQYLTLVHAQPFHAQIDLEARADENQLVFVGSLGRIMTVVADSSRRTRTVLTVQATNMGLAAARFKVVARECSPELPELLNEKINEDDSSFIVLPPKHTQSIIIDMPAEIPTDVAHCSVTLINGDHQSVAVRDVTIRKGDRCFCVWHCECVCLGEDPKLSCREMAEARQVAAGLEPRERTRLVRAVCYHDVLALDLCLTACGVLIGLLLVGLLKACLGLSCRCVGMWGLARVLQMPRKLDHYYDSGLRERPVLYDDEGWPVHPDTKQRSVRLISLPMEFVLNLIFFVTAPCVIVFDGLKKLCSRCKLPRGDESSWSLNKSRVPKKCYNSRDNIVQSSVSQCRQRRGGARLQRWMTPEAETLTSNVLQEGLPTRASMIRQYMRPLLCEGQCRGDAGARAGVGVGVGCAPDSCADSELDDTEYVLMQMQKSRESLARSQRKLNGSACTTVNK